MSLDEHTVSLESLERGLADWLASEAPSRAPVELRERVHAATAQLPQRSWRLPNIGLRRQPAGVLVGVVSLAAVAVLAAAAFVLQPEPMPAGQFTPAGTLAQARYGHTATLLADGRVLIVGGSNRHGPAVADVFDIAPAELWDPRTRTFSAAGELIEPRVKHTATLLADGRVLIVGGVRREDGEGGARWVELASAEIWDPRSRTFSAASPLAQARAEHTATLLADGYVLIAGGASGSGRGVASTELWDPARAEFVDGQSMKTPRSGHTATLVADGRVLVTGGSRSTNASPLSSTELWDPATGEFIDGGSMSESRQHAAATLLADGRVLIIGGGPDAVSMRQSAEVWDPVTSEFTLVGEYGVGGWGRRPAYTAALPDGRVFVFGQLGSIEQWHPESRAFAVIAELPEVRTAHSATALTSGRVLIVGGMVSATMYSETTASAVLFDPDVPPDPSLSPPLDPPGAGVFVAAASLPEFRTQADATRLADGRLLIYGGYSESAATDCAAYRAPPVLEWDSATQSLVDIGSLPESREGHALVALADGRFLAVGGSLYGEAADGCHEIPTTSASLWDPLANTTLPAGSLASPRVRPITVLVDGRVLVLGGSTPDHEAAYAESLPTAEVWEPASQSFSPAGELGQARSSATATLLADGRVLVVGGTSERADCVGDPDADDSWNYSCAFHRHAHRSAEIWDPATLSFSLAGSLGVPRTGHTATLLADGRVLIIGGRPGEAGWGWHSSAEIWDPATGTFSAAGVLPDAQPLRTATLLEDGRVLVVGGRQSMVWDPLSGTFAADAWLNEPRIGHGAALMADGRVLIFGGISPDLPAEPVQSVEVYQPAGR